MNPQISILSAIPNGQTITFADFAKRVGSLANALAFTQPKTLSRRGSHLTFNCVAGKVSSPAGSLEHQSTVTANVSESASSITLDSITGVTAHNGDGLGGEIIRAVITPLSNGHFKVDATVHVVFIEKTITVEIDQTGKVVG